MNSSSQKKVQVIESLRGFAAFYVVIHHFFGFTDLKKAVPEIFHFPFRFGQEIVLLFFFMSGFVIYVANQKIQEKKFVEYFKKRIIRIYPTFILTLVLSVVVLSLNKAYLKHADFIDLIGNIFMLQDTGNKPGAIVYPFLQNYPLWSLSYEWWFYMLFFPISYYISKYAVQKQIANIYLILIISATAWIMYLIFPNHLLLVVSHLIIWWAGVDIARLYFSGIPITHKTMFPIYLSLGIMTLLSLIPLVQAIGTGFNLNVNDFPFIDFRHFAAAIVILFVGNILYNFNINLDRIIKPFGYLAPISYALYCVHFPIILLEIPIVTNIFAVFIIKILLILGISYLSEIVIQPLFNKLNQQKSKSILKTSNV